MEMFGPGSQNHALCMGSPEVYCPRLISTPLFPEPLVGVRFSGVDLFPRWLEDATIPPPTCPPRGRRMRLPPGLAVTASERSDCADAPR